MGAVFNRRVRRQIIFRNVNKSLLLIVRVISKLSSLIPTVSQNAMIAHTPLSKQDDCWENIEECFGTED